MSSFDRAAVNAYLILENGTVLNGKAFGYIETVAGEIVFATNMTGYQEIMTDPNYAGKIIVLTYPLIGNYGVNLDDMESDSPKLKGVVTRECCAMPNNWRCEMDLGGFLKQYGITCLEGIDTRSLAKTIRDSGIMKAVITTEKPEKIDLTSIFNSVSCSVKDVTARKKYTIDGSGTHLAVLDLGVKKSVLNAVRGENNRLSIYPAGTSATDILADSPDGIVISNGPGDCSDMPEILETVKELSMVKPLFGIGLGCRIITAAFGGETGSLKFGHHGGNIPVKCLENGRVYITSQSHEHIVTQLPEVFEATFINVNDGSVEGFKHKTKNIMGIEFQPDCMDGPNYTNFMFDKYCSQI